MAEAAAAAAAATPLLGKLPDEIVLWEIFVRLDPKSLLSCRAVRRDWRSATSAHRFLLAHHARQPALPILRSEEHHTLLTIDHRAAPDAQLHTVARLDNDVVLKAACDGLLVLSKGEYTACSRARRLSVCNPVTRQHVSLGPLPGFRILGMYPHRPTGEYRLLLQKESYMNRPNDQTGFYVLPLSSGQPPRYIGCSGTKLASAFFDVPAKLRGSLHWYPVYYPIASNTPKACTYDADRELVIIFDTEAESFREMRAPVALTESRIFEMDDTIGIYSCNKATRIVDIRVMQNYESQVWDLKYRVELPMAEIRGKLQGRDGEAYWYVTVVSGDGAVLLLVRICHSMFYVDTDGKLVASFQDLYASKRQLKQTLVPHDFFTAREGFAMDASPFI